MRKFFSFFAIAAVVLGMASCGDGNEPVNPNSLGGVLSGKFTVAEGKQVQFSQGNLQYRASTDTWRFAVNQWDYVGGENDGTVYVGEEKCSNTLISAKYDGWIDLFGWGTSGYGGKYPYMTSKQELDYLGNGKKDIAHTLYDWGVNNAISNGGNRPNTWRTLSQSELYYLFYTRRNCGNLYAYATVHDVCGVIILPDGFEVPSTIDFTPYKNGQTFSKNVYSDDEWSQLEKAGAVFLPTAGYRIGETTEKSGNRGVYWSSTYDDNVIKEGTVYALRYDNDNPLTVSVNIESCFGHSVRLVRTVGENQENTTISAPEGAVDAVFELENGKRFFFSKGNLQYNVSTHQWQFADHQWEYLGKANENSTGWTDLFEWTSSDWGKKMGDKWQTPTKEDWDYLRLRKNSKFFGLGSVNGVNGCFFLPNNWVTPSGLTFVSSVTDINKIDANGGFELKTSNFTNNEYNADQWKKMEKNGAVFIPAAGYREGNSVKENGSEGRYWSATNNGEDEAYYYVFSPTYYNPNYHGNKSSGQSVRLIYVINK